MSRMRLFVVAAVLVGLAAAADRACATGMSTNDLFDEPTPSCTQWNNCTTTLCTCSGSTSTTTAALGCLGTTTKTCADMKTCALNYITCLTTAAQDGACQLASNQFNDLSMALMGVMSATQYKGSSVQTSCRRAVCVIMNKTKKGDTCDTETGYADNSSATCIYTAASTPGNGTGNASTPKPPSPPPTPAASAAASVSTAVLAVLATVALLM